MPPETIKPYACYFNYQDLEVAVHLSCVSMLCGCDPTFEMKNQEYIPLIKPIASVPWPTSHLGILEVDKGSSSVRSSNCCAAHFQL